MDRKDQSCEVLSSLSKWAEPSGSKQECSWWHSRNGKGINPCRKMRQVVLKIQEPVAGTVYLPEFTVVFSLPCCSFLHLASVHFGLQFPSVCGMH